MTKPGFYTLDGHLFAAVRAPVCFVPQSPGVRLEALRGYVFINGTWKNSGTVDVKSRKPTPVTLKDSDKTPKALARMPSRVLALAGFGPKAEAPAKPTPAPKPKAPAKKVSKKTRATKRSSV